MLASPPPSAGKNLTDTPPSAYKRFDTPSPLRPGRRSSDSPRLRRLAPPALKLCPCPPTPPPSHSKLRYTRKVSPPPVPPLPRLPAAPLSNVTLEGIDGGDYFAFRPLTTVISLSPIPLPLPTSQLPRPIETSISEDSDVVRAASPVCVNLDEVEIPIIYHAAGDACRWLLPAHSIDVPCDVTEVGDDMETPLRSGDSSLAPQEYLARRNVARPVLVDFRDDIFSPGIDDQPAGQTTPVQAMGDAYVSRDDRGSTATNGTFGYQPQKECGGSSSSLLYQDPLEDAADPASECEPSADETEWTYSLSAYDQEESPRERMLSEDRPNPPPLPPTYRHHSNASAIDRLRYGERRSQSTSPPSLMSRFDQELAARPSRRRSFSRKTRLPLISSLSGTCGRKVDVTVPEDSKGKASIVRLGTTPPDTPTVPRRSETGPSSPDLYGVDPLDTSFNSTSTTDDPNSALDIVALPSDMRTGGLAVGDSAQEAVLLSDQQQEQPVALRRLSSAASSDRASSILAAVPEVKIEASPLEQAQARFSSASRADIALAAVNRSVMFELHIEQAGRTRTVHFAFLRKHKGIAFLARETDELERALLWGDPAPSPQLFKETGAWEFGQRPRNRDSWVVRSTVDEEPPVLRRITTNLPNITDLTHREANLACQKQGIYVVKGSEKGGVDWRFEYMIARNLELDTGLEHRKDRTFTPLALYVSPGVAELSPVRARGWANFSGKSKRLEAFMVPPPKVGKPPKAKEKALPPTPCPLTQAILDASASQNRRDSASTPARRLSATPSEHSKSGKTIHKVTSIESTSIPRSAKWRAKHLAHGSRPSLDLSGSEREKVSPDPTSGPPKRRLRSNTSASSLQSRSPTEPSFTQSQPPSGGGLMVKTKKSLTSLKSMLSKRVSPANTDEPLPAMPTSAMSWKSSSTADHSVASDGLSGSETMAVSAVLPGKRPRAATRTDISLSATPHSAGLPPSQWTITGTSRFAKEGRDVHPFATHITPVPSPPSSPSIGSMSHLPGLGGRPLALVEKDVNQSSAPPPPPKSPPSLLQPCKPLSSLGSSMHTHMRAVSHSATMSPSSSSAAQLEHVRAVSGTESPRPSPLRPLALSHLARFRHVRPSSASSALFGTPRPGTPPATHIHAASPSMPATPGSAGAISANVMGTPTPLRRIHPGKEIIISPSSSSRTFDAGMKGLGLSGIQIEGMNRSLGASLGSGRGLVAGLAQPAAHRPGYKRRPSTADPVLLRSPQLR